MRANLGILGDLNVSRARSIIPLTRSRRPILEGLRFSNDDVEASRRESRSEAVRLSIFLEARYRLNKEKGRQRARYIRKRK